MSVNIKTVLYSYQYSNGSYISGHSIRIVQLFVRSMLRVFLLFSLHFNLSHPNSRPPSAGKKKTAKTANWEYGGLALDLARKFSFPWSSRPLASDPVLCPLRSGEVSMALAKPQQASVNQHTQQLRATQNTGSRKRAERGPPNAPSKGAYARALSLYFSQEVAAIARQIGHTAGVEPGGAPSRKNREQTFRSESRQCRTFPCAVKRSLVLTRYGEQAGAGHRHWCVVRWRWGGRGRDVVRFWGGCFE